MVVPATQQAVAAFQTARRLIDQGQATQGLDILMSSFDPDQTPIDVLKLQASALRTLGRTPEAMPLLERVAAGQPDNVFAFHNLAAAAGDVGDLSRSEQAARRALAIDARPETRLVLARALQGQGRFDEAQAALGEALSQRPDYGDAHRDLAQLIWMRTGDAVLAGAVLDARLASGSPTAELAALRAMIVNDMVGPETAYRDLAAWTGQDHLSIETAATATSVSSDPQRALGHAQAALRLAPNVAAVRNAYAAALIGAGRPQEAGAFLDAAIDRDCADQYALALQRTAWRLNDDPRQLTATDYATGVQTFHVPTPGGWTSRTQWLSDLATSVRRLHAFGAEPFGQSIRRGAQSVIDPRWAAGPVIDATFEAFREPISRYVAGMSAMDEPMGRRRSAGWDIVGAWSVRLNAGGHHSDHVHPNGWVSSAFYIDLPDVADPSDKAGWLRFGAADLGRDVRLEAQHWVRPERGLLALFPSYFWHGTEPFASSGERLTIAFDLRPS